MGGGRTERHFWHISEAISGAKSYSRTLARNHRGWGVTQQPSCHLILIFDPSIDLLLLYPLTALLGGGGGGGGGAYPSGRGRLRKSPPTHTFFLNLACGWTDGHKIDSDVLINNWSLKVPNRHSAFNTMTAPNPSGGSEEPRRGTNVCIFLGFPLIPPYGVHCCHSNPISSRQSNII